MRCFSNFLKHHINVGFERGFQDNISKHGGVNSGERLGPPLWEMPTLSEWLLIADKIYEFLIVELTSDEGHPHCEAMMTLRDDLETEIMFSELRCKKILPTAMAAYKEGLPQHYTQEYHQAKLLAAMSLYSMQARGPASEKLAEVLAAECLAYWQAGRQMCEELSLTGNHCTARRHTVPGTKEENSGKVLPSMPHSSGVQYIAACNCGRKQANREDPFTLVDANFNFYQGLELECCKDLEHISFPEHSPVKTGGLKDIRLDAKEDKVEKIGKGEQARKTSSEMENHVEKNTEEEERSDTPAQDDAAIILEVLEHLHIEPAGTGKSPSKAASFYRPDVAPTISSPSCFVVSSSLPTVSLSCPVSLSRQSIPVRTEGCAHPQTFDLHSAIFSLKITDIIKSNSFLTSRRNGNEWKMMYENIFCCPICQVKGPLYVDATITAALACLPVSVPKIAFTESGRFMAVEHQQVEEGCPVVTLQDSPFTYNTPCYLLPTSRATPPYMPSPCPPPCPASCITSPPRLSLCLGTRSLLSFRRRMASFPPLGS